MNTLFSKAFWQDAGLRAIKTGAQAIIGAIGVETIGLVDLDWLSILNLAGAATLLSILGSIATIPAAKQVEAVASATSTTSPKHRALFNLEEK